jgi:UDP-N-acetylmuramyl tripeptide synthase
MQKTSMEYFNQKKRDYKKLRSILVTGTKGKTSTSLMINHLFDFDNQTTLYVSTSGVYQNKKLITDYQSSIRHFGLAPTVMPGRYVYQFLKDGNKPDNFTAILESSLSCGVFSTGLFEHKVGALLNIYSDHIGDGLINTRKELYEMKSFIFKNLTKKGHYIVNYDNDLSRKSLSEPILAEKEIQTIAITVKKVSKKQAEEIKERFKLKDLLYTQGNDVYSLKKGLVYSFSDFPYLKFFTHHSALKENLLTVLAIGLIYFDKKFLKKALSKFRFPFEFGRMMLFEDENTKQKLIVDYAHEPESLRLMVENLVKVYQRKPHLVSRAATHRTDASINKLSLSLAKLNISSLTIYDLMSGKSTVKEASFGSFSRRIGEVADLVYRQVEKRKPNFAYKIVPKEIEALNQSLAEGNEVILHIYGNIKQLKIFVKEKNLKRLL